MLRCIRTFLDICYLLRRSFHNTDTIANIETKVAQFHELRNIFITTGVRETISLPRQHSLVHYADLIREFGAPNGLCSSITETKHIAAVKKPWRRSNRHDPLGQMLLMNQRLDKLHAARVDFFHKGMLGGTVLSDAILDSTPGVLEATRDLLARLLADDGGPLHDPLHAPTVELARHKSESGCLQALCITTDSQTHHAIAKGGSKCVNTLSHALGYTRGHLRSLIQQFLSQELNGDIPVEHRPDEVRMTSDKLNIYGSAVVKFYAPSDSSGRYGMTTERLRSVSNWRGEGRRHDTAYVTNGLDLPGFRGMSVCRIRLLFSFEHDNVHYPCALVDEFVTRGNAPDQTMGMWVVQPDVYEDGDPITTVIRLDSIFRAAHLMPVYGHDPVPFDFDRSDTLDAFEAFYVNQYIDHHAHEFLN